MDQILVPDYYEAFHCKCGRCRRPCCDGWGISLSEHEYFKLLGLACEPRLRHKLDDAIVLSRLGSPEAYASFRPNYLAQCPMLDDDGLCLLQKEKGEAELPLVCRLYPRAVKRYGSLTELSLSCSCEAAVELLLSDTAPLRLHPAGISLPFEGLPVYADAPEKDVLRHRLAELLSTPGLPLDSRLAQACELVSGEAPARGGERKSALQKAYRMLELLSGVSDSLRECSEEAMDYLGADGDEGLLPRFDRAEARLYALFDDPEALAGRLIANHLLYESLPYTPDCESPDTAMAAFFTAVALLKLIAVGGMAAHDEPSRFVDLVAGANRFIEHSDFYRVVSRLEHPSAKETFEKFEGMIKKRKI